MDVMDAAVLVGTAAGSLMAIAIIAWSLYARFLVVAPPSRALVIFGRTSSRREEKDPLGRTSRVGGARFVVGGAAFVFPWTHRYESLALGTLDVDVPVRATLLSSGDEAPRVELRLGVQVKISSDPEGLRAAAENLLGKSEAEVHSLVRSVVEGHVHSVLARVSSYLLEAERERVASEVQVLAATDLVAMGLVVQSMGLKEIVHFPRAPLGKVPEPPHPPAPEPNIDRTLWEVASHLRLLEKRFEEYDRRSRTPEIHSLVSDLTAGGGPRVADLR